VNYYGKAKKKKPVKKESRIISKGVGAFFLKKKNLNKKKEGVRTLFHKRKNQKIREKKQMRLKKKKPPLGRGSLTERVVEPKRHR